MKLSREHVIAGPEYKRWWVIPAALAIELSVGQAYAFSVFNLPMTKVIGITESAPGDWKLSTLGWIFTLAYIFLGLSAGLGGKWQDRVGPRISGLVAACCFSGGFFISALGIYLHQIWLLYLGYGVLGGCGLGLGFNTPIAPLIRWFPDRRGFATGMAVMGYGGGAFIAAPMSNALMKYFSSLTSVGVGETFLFLGVLYLLAMSAGALLIRLPPSDREMYAAQKPATAGQGTPAGTGELTVERAMRTPQGLLLWCLLGLNVTAGLGVLGQASAMIQEMFASVTPEKAAWFVAFLSIFNMSGRLIWSSLSDSLGRRATFGVFFLLGPLVYAMVPYAGQTGNLVLFVGCFAVILTMYGGGFATMPPYIADLFGSRHVGAINGRVLTALSAAGIVGPVVVNYMREFWIGRGYSKSTAYDSTMYIMAALLCIGFLCNLAMRPVAAKHLGGAEPKKTLAPQRTTTTYVLVVVAVAAIFIAGLTVGWMLQG